MNYSIAGPLEAGNMLDVSVSVRVERENDFQERVNHYLQVLFVMPRNTIIWAEVGWNGYITISGKYKFDESKHEQMNQILNTVICMAAHESKLDISGKKHFYPDQEGWELRT